MENSLKKALKIILANAISFVIFLTFLDTFVSLKIVLISFGIQFAMTYFADYLNKIKLEIESFNLYCVLVGVNSLIIGLII